MGMPQECLHAGGWLCPLQLPYLNAAIEAATGEQLAVRAPGQRVHSAALTSQRLHVRAGGRIPEPDERIIPAAGEQAPIRGKGHCVDAVRMPIRPEQGYLSPRQGSTLQVPQFDAAIPAPAGQRAFVWAEGEGRHIVGMRLPDEM